MCLAATVLQLRKRARAGDVAADAVVLGAILWTVATLIQLGGDQAVARIVARGDSIEAVDAVSITVGKINDTFELASLLAVGTRCSCSSALVRSSVAAGRG